MASQAQQLVLKQAMEWFLVPCLSFAHFHIKVNPFFPFGRIVPCPMLSCKNVSWPAFHGQKTTENRGMKTRKT